jgi:NAD(P) transhydrogenase
MSPSLNCLAGSRALAFRPRRGSFLAASPKQCAFISGLKATRLVGGGDRSNTLTTTSLRGLTRPHPLSLQQHVSQVTAVARYASGGQVSDPHDEELPSTPPFTAGPYSNLTIGVPKESYPGERRVAITPQVNPLVLVGQNTH